MLQIKSFPFLFPLSISSINTKHHSQPQRRNPSPCTNPYFAKIFLKLLKIEFQNPASFSQNFPSKRAQEVSRSHKHPLLEAQAAQIEPSHSHRFAIFLNLDFYNPCI